MTTREKLEKLCKWRSIFAGWQLGTRPDTDPECQAVRDHRELTILLRVEVNALTQLLIEKGIFTAEEFDAQLGEEAEHLDRAYERKFPGIESTPAGMAFVDLEKARRTMAGWRP